MLRGILRCWCIEDGTPGDRPCASRTANHPRLSAVSADLALRSRPDSHASRARFGLAYGHPIVRAGRGALCALAVTVTVAVAVAVAVAVTVSVPVPVSLPGPDPLPLLLPCGACGAGVPPASIPLTARRTHLQGHRTQAWLRWLYQRWCDGPGGGIRVIREIRVPFCDGRDGSLCT